MCFAKSKFSKGFLFLLKSQEMNTKLDSNYSAKVVIFCLGHLKQQQVEIHNFKGFALRFGNIFDNISINGFQR